MRLFILTLVGLLLTVCASAQKVTTVSGTVYDAYNKKPLPFVDVYFMGTYVGATTDLDGKYTIKTRYPSDTLVASFLSYIPQSKIVQAEEKQTIDFFLREEGVVMESVEIRAKKGKYRKKDNPAVELMRKVIENKDRNSLAGQDFYNFDKHEKLELDLNNITEEFKDRKIFRNFEFLWNYLDTSSVNGRIFLPMYIREILSSVHYRKNPQVKKEKRKAVKMTSFDEALDEKSISSIVDLLYQDVNIYDNNITLLDNQFLSPLAPWALNYYRFYIIDTTVVDNKEAIHLAFIPRNTTFIGFTGDLFVSNDGRYTILKAELSVTKDINMNFVRDVKVVLEFDERDSVYVTTKDIITLDIALSEGSLGFYATREITYDNYNFDPPPDESVYGGIEEVITDEDAYEKPESFWKANRISHLSEKENELYKMIDTLKTVPAYKNIVKFTKIITTGFIPAGPVDLGKIAYFVSKNDIEGWRFRMGFETSHGWSQRWQGAGYASYGLKDKAWKYSASLMYSFTEDYRENPKHYVMGSYRHDVVFPGQKFEFIENDNFLTSFRRGEANKMLFNSTYNLDYFRDNDVGFIRVGFEHQTKRPYGSLEFTALVDGEPAAVPDITSSEFNIAAEYAPNTGFIQGRTRRTPIISYSPVVQLTYGLGIKNLLGGDYTYNRVSIRLKKRIPMSIVGRSRFDVEAGRIWGKNLPYLLLYIPQANQSYSYQPTSFNMMNFLEFTADKYVRVNYEHFFDGFVFNRIPLWKRLGLKEVITFKMVYGALDDTNNPNLNPELIQFSNNANGTQTTYAFDDRPYIEYGVGIYNVFRFLRFDLIQRANYLENPNIDALFGRKGLSIRGRLKVEF